MALARVARVAVGFESARDATTGTGAFDDGPLTIGARAGPDGWIAPSRFPGSEGPDLVTSDDGGASPATRSGRLFRGGDRISATMTTPAAAMTPPTVPRAGA